MRKWTYLVAALLMGGVSTSLTSCIDNDEPAGITDLRGAKAELLRAKAQVELAEAEYRKAQIAIENAKAAYLDEKVKQEQFETAIKEAKSQKDIAYWQQEAQKSLEKFNAEMYALQQATAQAELEYQRAMAAIELALATVKDDVVANELYILLTQKVFNYSYTKYTYNPTTGQLQNAAQDGKYIIGGLNQLATEISNLNSEIAGLQRQKALLEFQYDPESLKLAVSNTVTTKKAEVTATEETLAELKLVAETPLEEFENKYKEIDQKLDKITAQKDELEIKKANDEEYQAAKLKEQEAAAERTAKGQFSFDIPTAIQDPFYTMVQEIITSNVASTANTNLTAINNAAVANTNNEYSYPNGFNLEITLQNQIDVLDALIKAMEGEYIGSYITKKALTAEELKEKEADLAAEKIIFEDLQTKRTAAEKTWSEALAKYEDLYNKGKYASTSLNARAQMIETYNKFTSDYNSAEPADQPGILDNFIKEYKAYVEARTLLDGLKLDASIDIIADKTKLSAWVNAYNNNQATVLGIDDIDNNLSRVTGGAAKAFYDAAVALGYETTRRTIISYEEWENANGNLNSIGIITTTSTLVNEAFTKEKTYTENALLVANVADWNKLDEALTALMEVKETSMTAINAKAAEAQREMAKVNEKYQAETAKLQAQVQGLTDIKTAMENVIKRDPNLQTGQNSSYETAIQNIKNQIAYIEGGSVTIGSSSVTYNKGSLAELKEELKLYEELLAAIEAGTFEEEETTTIKTVQASIDSKTSQRDALNVLFEVANKRKAQLLEALTGESSSTPETPAEGEETPAEGEETPAE